MDARGGLAAVMHVSSAPVMAYFVLVNTSLVVLITVAYVEFRAQQRRRAAAVAWEGGSLAPGVSLLVPAYNEEAGIVTAVVSLLSLRYPRHEVVVVDDGSVDRTFERLEQAFDLVQVPRQLPTDIPTGEGSSACTSRATDAPRSSWSARRTRAAPTRSTWASTPRASSSSR
ncbi:MAG TPA: glycosyltransferase [Intrasporangium sp.]|nr:glycosyltransferase [Intrasporangium sp.]